MDSIDFNSKTQRLNSPRSLEACRKLGIDPLELYSISLEEYKAKNPESRNLPKEILDMRYEAIENYRNKSIDDAKELRAKIIEEEEKKKRIIMKIKTKKIIMKKIKKKKMKKWRNYLKNRKKQ